MSKDIHTNRTLRQKKESKSIVNEILNFGVTDDQIFDIMFMLLLTVEDNEAMKDIAKVLKKYKKDINNLKDDNSVIKKENKKIILS